MHPSITGLQIGPDRVHLEGHVKEILASYEDRLAEAQERVRILEEQIKVLMSERNLVEEALRESEKRFRNIAFSMAGWIWEMDAQGVYTYASDKVKDILGLEPEDVVGKTFTDLIQPEKAQELKKVMDRLFLDKATIRDLEHRHVRENGTSIWLLTDGVPVFDEHGQFTGFRGVDKDITVQKEAEEERERLIRELQDAISKIKTLSGLIPICASCKKIRDDKGYWNQLEEYLQSHSEAEFSHSYCPDCVQKHYSEFFQDEIKTN